MSLRGLGCWQEEGHPETRPPKDEAECCNAKRDALGRLPIGYCGPECERRPR